MSRTCPACAGALGPGARWCGLCFVDLTAPACDVPEETAVAAAQPPAAQTAPWDVEPAGPPAVVVLPLVDPPAPVGATQPGWPCSVCSSVVPYESDTCPVCGAGFLSALTGSGLPRLPVVGTPGAAGRRGVRVLAAVFFGGVAMLLLLALTVAGGPAG